MKLTREATIIAANTKTALESALKDPSVTWAQLNFLLDVAEEEGVATKFSAALLHRMSQALNALTFSLFKASPAEMPVSANRTVFWTHLHDLAVHYAQLNRFYLSHPLVTDLHLIVRGFLLHWPVLIDTILSRYSDLYLDLQSPTFKAEKRLILSLKDSLASLKYPLNLDPYCNLS
jgi:hypothetical protein